MVRVAPRPVRRLERVREDVGAQAIKLQLKGKVVRFMSTLMQNTNGGHTHNQVDKTSKYGLKEVKSGLKSYKFTILRLSL